MNGTEFNYQSLEVICQANALCGLREPCLTGPPKVFSASPDVDKVLRQERPGKEHLAGAIAAGGTRRPEPNGEQRADSNSSDQC